MASTSSEVDMVDMSLDQIIKMSAMGNKTGNRRHSGQHNRQPGRWQNMQRRASFNGNNRRWSAPPAPTPAAATLLAPSNKIIISNLAPSVSNGDVQELFGDFGRVHAAALHHDGLGRSLGTAHVVFESRQSAARAVDEYRGVPLDGRAMNIQFTVNDADRNSLEQQRDPFAGISRVGSRTGAGGGGKVFKPRLETKRASINNAVQKRNSSGGGTFDKKKIPCATDLDKDMDKYMAAAKTD
jgi:THO complex subunit 4